MREAVRVRWERRVCRPDGRVRIMSDLAQASEQLVEQFLGWSTKANERMTTLFTVLTGMLW